MSLASVPDLDPDVVVSRSPQAPDDVVVRTPATAGEDVERAVAAARAAQVDWRAMLALSRSTALDAAADALQSAAGEMTALVVREVGKPTAEAAGEVERGVAVLRFYAQQALAADGETFPGNGPPGSYVTARRLPVGVAGLITPWNFPLIIPLWKAAAALAYGNAAVVKPAPEATACALRLGELLASSLPPGLFAVLPGHAESGQALLRESDAVSFTGSVDVGHHVVATATEQRIPVQAEMGGSNASMVLPDADIEHAASTVAMAAMAYAGQKCTATSRVIVVGSADGFVDALVDRVATLPVGDPSAPGTVVGPVISRHALEAVTGAAAGAVEAGGSVVVGGRRVPGSAGWFVQPTVVIDLDPGSWLAQNEVFGPICSVLPARDIDEAVALANGTRYGLATSIFTSDLNAMMTLPERLHVGLVRFNTTSTGADHHVPFGGEKASSHGAREQGTSAREFYTRTQTTTVFPAVSTTTPSSGAGRPSAGQRRR